MGINWKALLKANLYQNNYSLIKQLTLYSLNNSCTYTRERKLQSVKKGRLDDEQPVPILEIGKLCPY